MLELTEHVVEDAVLADTARPKTAFVPEVVAPQVPEVEMDFEKPITQLMHEMGSHETGVTDEAPETEAFPELDLAGVEATTPVELTHSPQTTLAFDFPDAEENDPFADLQLGSALDDYTQPNPVASDDGAAIENNVLLSSEPTLSEPESRDPLVDDVIATVPEETARPVPEAVIPIADVKTPQQERKVIEKEPEPENVLVISVVAKEYPYFNGPVLQKIISACGMTFGDMSIYHRFEDEAGPSAVQFSMANALAPGTFDPEEPETLSTKAVMFFMSMEEPRDVMDAFECMLATAETLAKHLGGEMLDENRSVLRTQTMEHYRQRVRDFEMKNLKKRGR